MKNKIKDTIVSVITTSIIYFLMSLLTTIFFADKGCVRISGLYKEGGLWKQNIELVNYSNQYQNEIYLKTPTTVIIENENNISTVFIEKDIINSEEFYLYKINHIQPTSSTIIVLKLENKDDRIFFTNLKEKRFSLETQGSIENPKFRLFKQLLPNAILYILIYSISQFIVSYYIGKRQEELTEKIKEKNKKFDEIERTLDKTQTKLRDVELKLHKTVFFFKKQLSDYSKENEFWRNTIRQLLYTGDKKGKKAEQLFEIVTNQLQTFSVKSKRNLDLNEIIFVAEELEEYDKKKSIANERNILE